MSRKHLSGAQKRQARGPLWEPEAPIVSADSLAKPRARQSYVDWLSEMSAAYAPDALALVVNMVIGAVKCDTQTRGKLAMALLELTKAGNRAAAAPAGEAHDNVRYLVVDRAALDVALAAKTAEKLASKGK
jgi:hypothetical protein